MTPSTPSEQSLLAENAELRARLAEAEETLRAIYSGEVDALVVQSPDGPRIFTLQGIDAESNRFRGEILAQVSDAVIAIDNERRITYFNAAVERQYGVSASNVLGRRLDEIYDFRWVRPEDAAASEAALRETGQWRGENIHLTRNGESIHVESSVSSLRAEDGTQTGLLAVIRDITERKRADEAIRYQAELLDKVSDAIVSTDANFRIQTWNAAAERIYGWKADEVLGRDADELFRTEFVSLSREEALAQLMGTGTAQTEVVHQDRHGQRRNVRGNVVLLKNARGDVTGTLGVLRDVTERKRAEEALAAAYRQTQDIIDNTTGIVYAFDLEERFVVANAPLAKLLNSTPALLIGKRRHDFMPHADAGWHEANDRKVFEAGRALDFEEQSELPGRSITWLTTKFPLRDAEGNIYAVGGFSMDITARKQAEEALKAAQAQLADHAANLERTVAVRTATLRERSAELQMANAALSESEERFRQMADNVREVFWLSDAERTRVFYVSPAYEDIWGRRCRDLASRPHAWLETVHPEDRERVWASSLLIINSGLPAACEYRIVLPDGSVRWIADQGVPVRDETGKVYRLAGVARDVTERKNAEAELKRVQEELLSISEREKQLIAQELHDGLCQHFAGTAMMSLLLHRRLAAKGDPEAVQAKQVCDLLNTGVREARNLSHGLHPVQPEPGGLMDALAGLTQTIAQLFHVECKFRCNGAVFVENTVAANHLFRITQEAVNNAMKHGQATKIVITLNQDAEGISLSIRDNGIGIPASFPATGMGMRIMNHRAALSGAVLSVRRASKRGGTVVTCTLAGRSGC